MARREYQVGFYEKAPTEFKTGTDPLNQFPEIVVREDAVKIAREGPDAVYLTREALDSNDVFDFRYENLWNKFGGTSAPIGSMSFHELSGSVEGENYIALKVQRPEWNGTRVVYVFERELAFLEAGLKFLGSSRMTPVDIVFVSDRCIFSLKENSSPETGLSVELEYQAGRRNSMNYIIQNPGLNIFTLKLPVAGNVGWQYLNGPEDALLEQIEFLGMVEEVMHTWQVRAIWEYLCEKMADEPDASKWQRKFYHLLSGRGHIRRRELFAKQRTHEIYLELLKKGLDLGKGLDPQDVADMENYCVIYYGPEVQIPKSAYRTVIPQVRRMGRNPKIGREVALARSKAIRKERRG